jgi:hypothetical protein
LRKKKLNSNASGKETLKALMIKKQIEQKKNRNDAYSRNPDCNPNIFIFTESKESIQQPLQRITNDESE